MSEPKVRPPGLKQRVARALESLPWIRRSVRAAYYQANYLCFRDRGFRFEVHPQAAIASVEEWIGSPLAAESGVFFGYYDKSPWSPCMTKLILHRLRADCAEILVADRSSHSWHTVGVSRTWNYQQGSMAQWLPWSGGRRLIYNDLLEGNLISRIVSDDGKHTLVPLPIQTVHPSAALALSLNYRRLARLRAEYGYATIAQNFAPDQALERDGIWEVDLVSGRHRLMLSIAQLKETCPRAEMQHSEHKVNHITYSPGGSRFAFLHRWLGPQGKFSRLYVGGSDESEPRLVLDHRMISHYTWMDDATLLTWARAPEGGDRYYLVNLLTGERQVVGKDSLDVHGDGHPSFSPDRRWIVTDSYPDRARRRHLLLYEMTSGVVIQLGMFFAPWTFDGARRCDLHPRWSPDGTAICIDSAHTNTRMMYLIDVRAIVEAAG